MTDSEIYKIEDMGKTPWELNKLVNLAVENYKKSAKTKVGWHISAEPGMVSLAFIDSAGNIFDQIAVEKHDYINIFKPALASIQIKNFN